MKTSASKNPGYKLAPASLSFLCKCVFATCLPSHNNQWHIRQRRAKDSLSVHHFFVSDCVCCRVTASSCNFWVTCAALLSFTPFVSITCHDTSYKISWSTITAAKVSESAAMPSFPASLSCFLCTRLTAQVLKKLQSILPWQQASTVFLEQLLLWNSYWKSIEVRQIEVNFLSKCLFQYFKVFLN